MFEPDSYGHSNPGFLNTSIYICISCFGFRIHRCETYGNPTPTEVSLTVEKEPFIVISGHDLYDLKHLLEQTKNKGINIYTHGEMLPAHAYPELKKYAHLKGNFGTAWQNQQKAVCILLTLLHLGIKNILLEPTLPAFISPNVLNFLAQNYNIGPITTPENDLTKILG